MKNSLMGLAGMKIRAGDGLQELGHPEMLSTPVFYFAQPGDQIRLIDSQYKFNVATYAPNIEDRWVYTYDYAPEQSWTVYREDLSGDTYRQDDYIFSECVYFRICLRKMDGTEFKNDEDINRILSFEREQPYLYEMKPWLKQEVNRVSECVTNLYEKGELSFLLLTDSHYTVNGTWNDTAGAIQKLHQKLNVDGIIHLGDFTDGMTTREASRYYVQKILSDLRKCDVPVWATLGNHDTNYFKNNPEPFSLKEQCELYLGRDEPRYAVDFADQRLRFIFLDSFDPNEVLRYGYSAPCIQWVKEQLVSTPDEWEVIIFSHVAPMGRLQYWAKEMRGEEELMKILHEHSSKIMAFINGHNHGDLIDNTEGFPILSILNSKCEAFTEYKSPGFITPHRKLGDSSQEAFDVMVVSTKKRQIRFVRFGAGNDKIILDGKAEWL